MPGFILHHRHHSAECGIAFAAWRGFDSPLRHHRTVGTCSLGGHELWWLVDASTPDGALDHTSGHAYLWDLRPERLLRQACPVGSRRLTRSEWAESPRAASTIPPAEPPPRSLAG